VTRTRARHDGRAVDVRLTPEGHRQVSAVQRARRAEIAQILARMPTAVLAESVDAWTAFERATVETTPAW
jgi:DNA-binding MarR family transcriptional regulator